MNESEGLESLTAVIRRLRRLLMRHRRLVTALLVALVALAAVNIWAPAAPETRAVAVAAHDLTGGIVLSADDVQVVQVNPELVPSGAAESGTTLIGDTLAGPVRAGEVITDRRVVGRGLLSGYADDVVGAPVHIADADVAALLEVGDHVDVYAATGEISAAAERIVADAPIVALPISAESVRDRALVVLAVDDGQAARLAQAGATTRISVALRAH